MSTSQVSLASAMRSNLLSLQNTSKQISQTQERLSTGKKVNTAMNNPTNYFAALSYSSRANALSTRSSDTVSISKEAVQAYTANNLTLGDTNEAADMLALQTQQTLSIQSLSLPSKACQSVLQLFR